METKKCTKCKEIKLVTEFNRSGQNYRRSDCRKCSKKQKRLNYWKNPEKYREQSKRHRQKDVHKFKARRRELSLLNTYNLTIDEYNQLFKAQTGACKICKKPETTMSRGGTKPLSVDHCHKTGKIRGLLCINCNTGLGKFKDDATALIRAIKYLKGLL